MIDRTYVINLNRRRDKWSDFLARIPEPWPFAFPERYQACDWMERGNEPPLWFQQPRGAWGCLQSHLGVWQAMLREDLESVLVLEDDVVFCDGFGEKASVLLANVPEDWGQVYLGGQHYRQPHGLPIECRPGVLRAFNVNRAHAYVIRADFAELAVRHVHDTLEKRPLQIDYILGDLHEMTRRAYCPLQWLAGQAKAVSDIARDAKGPVEKRENWWQQYYYVALDGTKRWSLLQPQPVS